MEGFSAKAADGHDVVGQNGYPALETNRAYMTECGLKIEGRINLDESYIIVIGRNVKLGMQDGLYGRSKLGSVEEVHVVRPGNNSDGFVSVVKTMSSRDHPRWCN